MADQELTHKKIFAVFIPALLLCGLALFIQLVRYEPLSPKTQVETPAETAGKLSEVELLPDDPILGNRRSPNLVVAFSDFTCGKCRQHYELFRKLEEKYPGKVAIEWKGLPVQEFPYSSMEAIRYGYCAAEQNKFNEFAFYAFENYTNLVQETLVVIADEIALDPTDLTECLSSTRPNDNIVKNKDIATFFNIQGVPTFFLNNIQLKENQIATLEDWEKLFNL